VVVMEPAQGRAVCERFGTQPRDVVILGDLDPELPDTRAIRDPVNQPADVFDEVYARIERCVGALAGVLARLPSAVPTISA
jgi:protein-tyrosine-phosphatase